jgi:NrtR DNA-binding winged helix domain
MINLVMQTMTSLWFDGEKLCATQTTSTFLEPDSRVTGTHVVGDALVIDSYQAWDPNTTEAATKLDDVPEEVLADLRLRYSQPDRNVMREMPFSIDPAGLMPPEFTILQLRKLYAAIYGHPFPKDTLRRKLIGGLDGTGRFADDFGRPAELFRIRGAAA